MAQPKLAACAALLLAVRVHAFTASFGMLGSTRRLGLAPLRSAVVSSPPPPPAAAEPDRVPELPPDALVLTSSDEATWRLEAKEYKALAADPAQQSFVPLLDSFKLQGKYYHAFAAKGTPLAGANFAGGVLAKDDGGPLPQAVADAVRISLVKDLLEGVVWCHLQGAPHLALDGATLRVWNEPPLPGRRYGLWKLGLVGLGAGAQLVTRQTPYQVGNESWAFNPPETLGGALLKGNLPGLYKWDAWSCGVALAALCSSGGGSPFAAAADVSKLTFSPQAAVARKIKDEFNDFSGFLTTVNAAGGGFLFRHGWVAELLVGLLKTDPDQRLSVIQARDKMNGALLAANPKERAAKAKQAKDGALAAQAKLQAAKGSSSKGGGKPPVAPLTAEETAQLRTAFAEFDADGSGEIDADEIVAALTAVGVTVSPEQASLLIAEVDEDGNGKLDFTEFIVMAQDLVKQKGSGDGDDGAAISATAVFGSRLAAAEGEPYRSLESIISIADKGLSEVVIQARPTAQGGNLKNYGEIVGFRNRADGDRWDVLVPGLEKQLPVDSRHRLSTVLGVILIKGGNHKLVVALGGARPDAAAVKADVDSFMATYAASHPNVRSGERVRYLELEDPFSRTAGSLDVNALPLQSLAGDVEDTSAIAQAFQNK